MKIIIDIPDDVIEKVIRGIMDNFPEASSGCELHCIGFAYKSFEFEFEDSDGKRFNLDMQKALEGFKLMFTDKWPKGCTKLCFGTTWETWDDWICEADAQDFDAFVQLALLGEVIYG